jgi:hypothetical protein
MAPSKLNLFDAYTLSLLRMAIERAGLPHQLAPIPLVRMSQGRLERELVRREAQLDLIWVTTSLEREQTLSAVKVPLDRGLMGWRACLVRQADLDRWPAELGRMDIASRLAGQGEYWPDVDILKANDFRVETAVDRRFLYQMLRAGRIDYFPRSVLEAVDELKDPDAHGLAIAPHFVLRYPAACYAFLRPEHIALVEPLTRALESMALDGSIDRLFRQSFQGHLDRLAIASRHIIDLHNPLLPPGTPLQRPEFWWQPGSTRTLNQR